jgi:hypothetical protein
MQARRICPGIPFNASDDVICFGGWHEPADETHTAVEEKMKDFSYELFTGAVLVAVFAAFLALLGAVSLSGFLLWVAVGLVLGGFVSSLVEAWRSNR